jgi:carboxyl-terminal processing protease
LNLESIIETDLEKELYAIKQELKEWIESEIVSRYYFQSGMSRHGFRFDLDVLRAIEVLKNEKEYNALLKK